jgi:hypothetical protein
MLHPKINPKADILFPPESLVSGLNNARYIMYG